MSAPMRFTTFESVKDNVPVTYEGWDKFKKLFYVRVTDNKHAVPLYCPAEYIQEQRLMENVLCVNFGVIDIDNATEEQVDDALDYLVEEENLKVIIHSTHSQQKGKAEGKEKCRLIIPFSRPVEPEEWNRVWQAMNDMVDGIADPQCKNPNAIYFFPSCPDNDAAKAMSYAEVENENGTALDIDEVLEMMPEEDVVSSFIPKVDAALISKIAADVRYKMAETFITERFPKLDGTGSRNSTAYRVTQTCGDFGLDIEQAWVLVSAWNGENEYPLASGELESVVESAYKEGRRKLPIGWRLLDQAVYDVVDIPAVKKLVNVLLKKSRSEADGRWLSRLVEEEPIGVDAVRIFDRAAKHLGERFTGGDSTQIASLFEESIKKTHTAGNRDITIEWVAERIQQAQNKKLSERAVEHLDTKIREKAQIQDAYRSVGIYNRATPYTDEEIEEFTEEAGLEDPVEFQRRWVIRYNKFTYFFIGGRYTRPYGEGESFNAAQEALLPAGLSLFKEGANGGPIPMKMHEIVNKYGTVANSVEIDLRAQHSHYLGETKTLVEAPRHSLRTDLKPVFSKHVDRWLRSFTPDDDVLTGLLLDWIACVTLIEHPLCALVPHGRPQVGKSMLADGLARLWIQQGTATPLGDVAGNWNSIIVEDGCPVLLADESLPQDFRGQPRTDFLRRIVQARSQTLHRKMIPDATLKGCVRVIVAVNDLYKELVPRNSELTNADIAAINERLLCIHVKDTNDEPLKALADIRKDPDIAKAFFQGDLIAEHALWLHKNRKVVPANRFLVEGLPNSELAMLLTTGTGLRSEICNWITNMLIETKDIKKIGAADGPIIETGRDGTTRLLLTAAMVNTLWQKYLPLTPAPATGLVERALGGVCEHRVRKGSDWYRQVDLLRVKYWAVTTGVCNSEERFDAHLEKHGLSCGRLAIDEDYETLD